MTRGPSGVVRAMVVVVASSGTALGLGFLKNILAAYYFGTSGAMDAYLLALLIPDLAMQLARTGAFNFIPLFAGERRRTEAEAWQAARVMIGYWLALLSAALFLAWVLLPLAIPLVAPGFDHARRQATLELARVLLMMAATVGAARILAVVLHAQRRFVAAGSAEVAFQAGSTAFLVACRFMGVEALALAQVFGGLLQLLVVAIALWPQRRLLRPSLDFASGSVRRLVRLSLPVYVGDTSDKVNVILTRAFASLLPAGAVSGLQYAYAPVEGIHRLLSGPLTAAFFPFLSSRFAEQDQRGALASLGRALVTVVFVFTPCAAALWLVADPLVVVLFERGSFDIRSSGLSAAALRLYAPAVVALALNELVGASFHARQDTLTPMRAGFVRVATNAVLCAVLTPTLGHRGIAAATTLALLAKLAYFAVFLRRVFTPRQARRQLLLMARVLLAVGAMSALVFPVAAFASTPAVLESHPWLALVALSLACLSSYVAALWLFARRLLLLHVALLRRALVRPAGRLAASIGASVTRVPREAVP